MSAPAARARGGARTRSGAPAVGRGDRGAGAWEKLGLVYVAAGEQPWARTHAVLPTAIALARDRIRVFVAFLDDASVGRLGSVDVDARDPRRVLAVAESPLLDVGATGTFDEHGVTPMSIVSERGRLYLFYTGWQLGRTVRYTLLTGLAVSDDAGATFRRVSQVPVLDRADGELFFRTASWVRRENRRWRMWYIGGDRWIEGDGKQVPTYELFHATTTDLRSWPRRGTLSMRVAGGDEHGFGRPCVLRGDDGYRMWYSIRRLGSGYRLGYAESPDGLSWQRRHAELALDVSPTGWDSEMICYSCVLPTRHGTYLFYNGNNFGETGFGVAVRR